MIDRDRASMRIAGACAEAQVALELGRVHDKNNIFQSITFALALCVAGLAAPAAAFETYGVTGVPAGDTLALREEPAEGGTPSDWRELARIPADARDVLRTGRSKEVGAQRWAEVSYRGTSGWVNDKFLVAVGDPADLAQETFECAGTEPFWGVTLGPTAGHTCDTEHKSQLTTERVQPSTARLFPLLYRLKDGAGRSYRATITRPGACTDGMSDYEYAFEVLLSGDDTFEQGCCKLTR